MSCNLSVGASRGRGFGGTYVVKNNELVGPATLVGADSVEDAVSDELGQKLLDEQKQEKTTDQGQVEVVDLEEEVELEGLATTHELSATKDDDVVANEHGGRLLEGSHRGLSGDKAEVLGLVALDRNEGLLKDGPQLETEGTVKSGHAVADPFGSRHCCR